MWWLRRRPPPPPSAPVPWGQLPPPRLLLQWHVTERCNLRCQHCYQGEAPSTELPHEELLSILAQYEELLDRLAPLRGPGRRPFDQITVTGGEPFVRDDCFALLEALHRRRARFRFSVLTNGTLLDDRAIRRLKTLEPEFVQVSLDGTAPTHDGLRGAGNHGRVVDVIRRLRRAGLRPMVSFTAHRQNFREWPAVARLARRLGAYKVWTDRLVPAGRGAELAALGLRPTETREYVRLVRDTSRRLRPNLVQKTQVVAQRALQFMDAGDAAASCAYRCSAGYSLVTLLPNGDLLPCRRLPLVVGNVLHTRLAELYFTAPLLAALRDPHRIPAGCASCSHRDRCAGGARCQSLATTGSPFEPDPGCWRAAPEAVPSGTTSGAATSPPLRHLEVLP